MQAVTALGYQTSLKILEAVQYSASQSQKWLIMWGAKWHVLLTDFLITTNFLLLEYCNRFPCWNSYDSDHDNIIQSTAAPLPIKTIDEAVSDLLAFNWINPHILVSIKSIPQSSYKHSIFSHLFSQIPNSKIFSSLYIKYQAYICALQSLYQLLIQHNILIASFLISVYSSNIK